MMSKINFFLIIKKVDIENSYMFKTHNGEYIIADSYERTKKKFHIENSPFDFHNHFWFNYNNNNIYNLATMVLWLLSMV